MSRPPYAMSDPRRSDLETIRRVSPAEARALVESGDAVLVDTRDRRFYDEAHAVGALSVPFADIRRGPDEATRALDGDDRTLILYCT